MQEQTTADSTDKQPKPELSTRATGSPTAGLGVYAVAASFAGAVPIPPLDSWFAGLVRGAAIRRVAERHRIVLTRRASDILAQPATLSRRGSRAIRIARAVAVRTIAPFRIVSRAEDAITTLASAALFDHYLRSARTSREPVMAEREAQSVRRAIEQTLLNASTLGLRDVALACWSGVSNIPQAAAARAEGDERRLTERWVDAVLDFVAEVPAEFRRAAQERFDEGLREVNADET